MHNGNREWLVSLATSYSAELAGASVLEIGAASINGTARTQLQATTRRWIGVDICPGADVEIVCRATETAFTHGEFDILVCLSEFEHDPDWINTLRHNLQWIKEGGLVVLCWGAEGNLPHGPEPWAIVTVAEFNEAVSHMPITVVDAFFEGDRFTPDCPGCYDVVARKRTP